MARILMIVSAADRLRLADGTDHPTGFWAEEVAESHRVLTEAGHRVDIATPDGRRPVADPISFDERGGVDPVAGANYRAYLDTLDGLAAPLKLADATVEGYDAFYLPGGHGPMADLVADPALGRLLTAADDEGKLVAALCHGVAGLLAARRDDGTFTFAGRTMTSFSDEEERQGGLGERTPFFVEARLREQGAGVTPGAPWSSTVVADRNLVTGQNPQSSVDTAAGVAQLLDSGSFS
ncbi:type 1 glutamine amidotransferase domain-containing protein [Amycolatopsis sp. SID8362]|uniref:type 1 glutamine amidotransferase domain-containing protein n=1 Tax=Amycolatopsis sp. SID8362 TaxID=2690346 RepID=UPI001369355D|nr:type 1 glutamine amidotransferase domain-containing protein [Amycolatopsis sp. SID8362]NBH09129.1 type 1 glutamine amidotransferase domain-containing protein [Amycolatopsis sp. SID8362]NED45822.1 type 1 glutamine amidotransferase domain-containing protein [Amycolatopsis sp. SID8362]